MKKIFFLIPMFLLLAINIYASDTSEAENMKNKYSNIFTLDNKCSPLINAGGIAVDSNENIYIFNLMFSNIQVYKNNTYLYSYTINKDSTSGGALYIKIDGNDNLYLSLVRSNVGLKINNKQLVEAVDNYKNYPSYPKQELNMNYCKDIYGNAYQLHNILGYYYVIKTTPDGVKSNVYTIPLSHFLLKLFLGFLFIAFLIFIVFMVRKILRVFRQENLFGTGNV